MTEEDYQAENQGRDEEQSGEIRDSRCRNLYVNKPGVCKISREHCPACYSERPFILRDRSGQEEPIMGIDLNGSEEYLGYLSASKCPMSLISSRTAFENHTLSQKVLLGRLMCQFKKEIKTSLYDEKSERSPSFQVIFEE